MSYVEKPSVSPTKLLLSVYVLLLRVTWLHAKSHLRSLVRRLRSD